MSKNNLDLDFQGVINSSSIISDSSLTPSANG